MNTVCQRWTVGRGAEGGPETAEVFRCDRADLKDPVRDAVLGAGWAWCGLVVGKL